jgi:hypothetical protein
MSNASHRNEVDAIKAPRIPWGHLAAVVVLIVTLFAGLMLAASLMAPPAQAGTVSYLRPAVAAAGELHTSRQVTVFTRFLTLHAGASMGIDPAAHWVQTDNRG